MKRYLIYTFFISLLLFSSAIIEAAGSNINFNNYTPLDLENHSENSSSNWSCVYTGWAHSYDDDIYVEIYSRQEFGKTVYKASIYQQRNGILICLKENHRSVSFVNEGYGGYSRYRINYNNVEYNTRGIS